MNNNCEFMEKMLGHRIWEGLKDYYPGDRYVVTDINRVGTKPGSMVYKVKIYSVNKGYRDLYPR